MPGLVRISAGGERGREERVCVCVNSKVVASVVNSWQLFCP